MVEDEEEDYDDDDEDSEEEDEGMEYQKFFDYSKIHSQTEEDY
jgi:hypothetical protein